SGRALAGAPHPGPRGQGDRPGAGRGPAAPGDQCGDARGVGGGPCSARWGSDLEGHRPRAAAGPAAGQAARPAGPAPTGDSSAQPWVDDRAPRDPGRPSAVSAGARSRRRAALGPGGAVSALAGDLAAALDPVVFAEQTGLVPDPWQTDVLRSAAPRLL